MDSSQNIDLLTLFQKVIENNSVMTLLLITLGAGTWLIGGNILIARHYRRLGKSGWSGLKPFAFPFKNFNVREWLILFALAVASLGLFGVAIATSER